MFRMSILLLMMSLTLGFASAATAEQADGARLSRTCAGCHGTDGASPGKEIPTIGGQVDKFLQESMADFSADKRPGDVMRNLSKGYSPDEQKLIAGYFAMQPWVNTPHAAQSNAETSLVANCKGCHGAMGEGRGSFPRVAGQHPNYLYQSLLEYKQGARSSGLMRLVQKLDDATLKQMADYYSAIK